MLKAVPVLPRLRAGNEAVVPLLLCPCSRPSRFTSADSCWGSGEVDVFAEAVGAGSRAALGVSAWAIALLRRGRAPIVVVVLWLAAMPVLPAMGVGGPEREDGSER